MAVRRSTRRMLCALGVACVVAGVFPYVSWTSGPRPDPGVPPIALPGIGPVPDHPSRTIVRVGLPFSPLFLYEREESIAALPAPGGTLTIQSGEANASDNVKVVSFRSSYTWNWRFDAMSVSAAAAASGTALLLVVWWLSRRGPAPLSTADSVGEPKP